MGANIDDIDDLLTAFARAGAQILLQEVSVDTVKRIVGEGAVWPDMTTPADRRRALAPDRSGLARAAPTRRRRSPTPNGIFPMLMQLPGIKPEWLAKELIKRLDDKLDITTAFQIDAALDHRHERHGVAPRARPASAGRPDGLPGRRAGARPGGRFECAPGRAAGGATPARPDSGRRRRRTRCPGRPTLWRRAGDLLRSVLFRDRHHRHGQTRSWRHST